MSQSSKSAHRTAEPSDAFAPRHIGPSEDDRVEMLRVLGCASLDQLMDQTVPASIRLRSPLDLPPPMGEEEAVAELRGMAAANQVRRSLIGMGYYDCVLPPVIQRNVLENPGWYTQYTPYQSEISQGRLEALLNFQTMVADLTGLPLANASLLDEATAAAEAMQMSARLPGSDGRRAFVVAGDCHPQTLAVVRTRAVLLGIDVRVVRVMDQGLDLRDAFGLLLQYPDTFGEIHDYAALVERARAAGCRVVVATDLLALTLLRPPGEWGADIAVGSAQRFGVSLGYGGPHAAFLATRTECARQMPGRLVGVSKDAHGRPAYRLAVQTREQHIRREKATSNVCTAQVLLAILAGFYAVYHGPEGLRRIARRVRGWTVALAEGLRRLGLDVGLRPFFDTLRVRLTAPAAAEIWSLARARGLNLRRFSADAHALGLSLDERTDEAEIAALLEIFNGGRPPAFSPRDLAPQSSADLPAPHARGSAFLSHPVFHQYHSETEMLRYLFRLQSRDLSLAHSMIPLGSCTMKLNAASEMLPITWPEFARLHPYAPRDQARGYEAMLKQLAGWLGEITGLPAVSLQPNSGAQGEYAGLLVIRAYHASRGQSRRDVCLIPTSAHGTNPASAVMAGLRVVPVACDPHGNVDLADLEAKAAEHASDLAALMVTYPSTHGVFEEQVRDICDTVHRHGGQVYMDGANLNAQVGLCRPADCGADVCHLNLHKTFCIPHGGGGPGMGPIACAAHLAPFLPRHPLADCGDIDDAGPLSHGGPAGDADAPIGPVAAAPYGSAGILPISWAYIRMMGAAGLTQASQVAILNANYMAARLETHYPLLYRGRGGRVAHEFILDCRAFEKSAGVRVEDIAKRLMDYGFHAPTMSWPVPGTLMIEPTESESKAELDRFCDAMILIREEIRAVEQGRLDRDDNPLRHAPHTAVEVTAEKWPHPYARSQAAFPAPWLAERKFWPPVSRVDNVYGDRNLFCTCPPV